MRAAIYTRISLDQTGQRLGVERQLEDCQALAKRLGWEVTKNFDDNDISAFSGKRRPGFEALLDAIKAGGVDALICWHTDRLYRSMRDLLRLIDTADAARVQIKTVQGGELDLSTSAGRMVAKILGSVAEQESEHSSERRKRANAQRAAAGRWSASRRPFGYTLQGLPLEPEASAIRTAVADVLAGKSIRAVAREWNQQGLRTAGSGSEWTSPMISKVLARPRYAALVVHQGKVVGPGNWEPIISEDAHRGIVAYLSNEARVIKTGFERRHQGSGTYLCGVCNAPLVAFSPAGGKTRAYACPERHVRRQGITLDEYVDMLVVGRLAQTDITALVDGATVDVAELHTQKAALQARQDELAGLFAEGAISATQLRRGTAKFSAILTTVNAELAQATQSTPLADFAGVTDRDKLADRWARTPADLRCKIIAQLMTVTVNPCPRGLRRFDPSYIEIVWR